MPISTVCSSCQKNLLQHELSTDGSFFRYIYLLWCVVFLKLQWVHLLCFGPLHGWRGIFALESETPLSFPFSLTLVFRGSSSQTFFFLSHSSLPMQCFAFSLIRFPQDTTSLASGLSYVMQWVCCSHLELSVLMQPWLREVAAETTAVAPVA